MIHERYGSKSEVRLYVADHRGVLRWSSRGDKGLRSVANRFIKVSALYFMIAQMLLNSSTVCEYRHLFFLSCSGEFIGPVLCCGSSTSVTKRPEEVIHV